jgi:sec-independent protein translocase protein TatA
MLGLSGEHLLVLLIILLIFGPRRLPDLGHSIGRTIKNFKDGMNGSERNPEKPAQKLEAKLGDPKPAEPAQVAAEAKIGSEKV